MTLDKHLWLGSNLFGSEPLAKELGHLYGAATSNPEWDQVYRAVLQMDGDKLNEMALDFSEKGAIMVGGGNNGRYVVIYFPGDNSRKPSLTLSDLSLTGPDVELTVQIPSDYPARICVKLPLVLKVLEHFFHTGEISTDVRWEIDNTGVEAPLS